MSKFEEVFIAILVLILMGVNIIYQQSKINKLETMVSILSDHVDKNSKTQLILNDAYQVAMSNEVRISDHMLDVAKMLKDHIEDRSLHITPWQFQTFTNYWRIDTNNVHWYIDTTGGEWRVELNTNNLILL